jgi:hypothetical protein
VNAPTEEQRCIMIDKDMGEPQPLHLCSSQLQQFDWVYWREWGVMHVSPGMHTIAMATLLAFHHGHRNYINLARERGGHTHNSINQLADAFLIELPGTAFLSSQSTRIRAGSRANLNSAERAAFRRSNLEVIYLEDRI